MAFYRITYSIRFSVSPIVLNFLHKNQSMNYIRKDGSLQSTGRGNMSYQMGESIIWLYNSSQGWYRNGAYFDK